MRDDKITEYSRIFALIDTLPAFIVQGLFILIPFNIIQNIFNFCSKMGYLLMIKQTRFYSFMKYYQLARFIRIVLALIIFIPDQDELNQIQTISLIGIFYTAFDAIICNVILFIVQAIIQNKQEIKQFLKQQHIQQLKKQLFILNLACLSRWLLDIIAIILPANFPKQFEPQCPHENDINTYLYLVAGNICMHFLPIFIITKQYAVQNSEKQEQQINRNSPLTESLN